MSESGPPATVKTPRDSGAGRASVDSGQPRQGLSAGVAAAVGFAVGGVAFLLGSAVLVTAMRGAQDTSADAASPKEGPAGSASSPGATGAQVDQLRRQLAELSTQVARLEGALSGAQAGRIGELEKALRAAEAARKAGEQALQAKGMRGPLHVFIGAANKAGEAANKAGNEAAPQKADKEVF